jgi:hypothetical protein
MNKKQENLIKNNSLWNEWFAGLTDGDGCFYINKKNEISYELTTASNDSRILWNIKNTLKGGSIKIRSGSKSIRYRVKEKRVIKDIVFRLNGKLYNKNRLIQFDKVLQILEIEKIENSSLLDKKSSYLAGLIDSDGTITISVSKSKAAHSTISKAHGKVLKLTHSRGFNQLSLKVSLIDKENINLLKESYNFGTIYEEQKSLKLRAPKIKYHWTLRSAEEFSKLYELLKIFPLRGVKMHRIRLAFLYFKYKDLKYHLQEPGTEKFKIWEKFANTWFKYCN